MNLRIICVLILTVLGGCEKADVTSVKNGRLNIDETHTVGEIFDHLAVCESTFWNMVEDERGRHLVEYRCELKGVKSFYSSILDKKLTQIDQAYKQRIAEYDARPEQIQKEIDFIQSGLAGVVSRRDVFVETVEQFQSLNNFEDYEKLVFFEPADVFGSPADLVKEIRIASNQTRPDMAMLLMYHSEYKKDIRSLEYRLAEAKRKNVSSDIKLYSKEIDRVTSKFSSKAKSELEKILPGLMTQSSTVLKTVDQYISDKNIEIEMLQREIQDNRSNRQEQISLFEKERDSNVEIATVNSDVDAAYEVFRWIVLDDSKLKTVSGGTLIEFNQRDDLFKSHPNLRNALVVAYKNQATDYASYLKYNAEMNLVDFLGL